MSLHVVLFGLLIIILFFIGIVLLSDYNEQFSLTHANTHNTHTNTQRLEKGQLRPIIKAPKSFAISDSYLW